MDQIIHNFDTSNKVRQLYQLKYKIPTTKINKVIYKFSCNTSSEFHIGFTNRRLESRLKEHKKDDFSALKHHSMETYHDIDYNGIRVLASDSHKFQIKEIFCI